MALKFGSFRSVVHRLFGESEGAPAKPAEDGDAIRPEIARLKRSTLQDSIKAQIFNLRKEQRLAAAGKLHLINLAGLKEKFGDQWDQMAERIAIVMERALSRHLTPRDFHSRLDDGTYLIIFDQLSARDATVKCNLIAKEVLEKLFGNTDAAKNVEIQTAVANVDGNIDFELSNPLDVIAGLLDDAQQYSITADREPKVELTLEDIAPPKERLAPTIAPMNRGPTDIGQLLSSAERHIDRWQVHLPVHGRSLFDPAAESTRTPRNTAVDMTPDSTIARTLPERARPSVRFDDVQGLEFRYQPIWFAPKNAVIGYACRLSLKTADGLITAEELVHENSIPNASLNVDRLVLRRALADLAKLLAGGDKALTIIPLHGATFSGPSAWRQFDDIVSGLTPEMRNLLMFEISDATLLESSRNSVNMLHRLSRHARQVLARAPVHLLDLDGLRSLGFTGISTPLSGLMHDETTILGMTQRLATAATRHKMMILATDVPTKSLMVGAIANGIDHLGGPAVAEDLPQLARVMPFDLTDVYSRH